MTKIKKIGILCEDNSDYLCLKIIIKRLINIDNMPIDGFFAGGCSKLKRKAKDHSDLLMRKGCNMLILVHDLDNKDLKKLRSEIMAINCGVFFSHYLICIPVQEIEAWFLSDSSALRKALKLKRDPKIPPSPEKIDSPKEFLENLIYKTSNKEKRYLNTIDNPKIAEKISLSLVEKKCSSFKELSSFLKTKTYK